MGAKPRLPGRDGMIRDLFVSCALICVLFSFIYGATALRVEDQVLLPGTDSLVDMMMHQAAEHRDQVSTPRSTIAQHELEDVQSETMSESFRHSELLAEKNDLRKV